MKTSWVKAAWAGCACLLLLATTGRAEIAVAESMEWVLATSDRVVVGKVVKVDSVITADKKECQAVTVAISKTLKGAVAERATFLLHPYISNSYARQWLEESIPMVFCLVKNDGNSIAIPKEKFGWGVREDGTGPDVVLLGKSKHHWTGGISVFTRDFEVITEPDAMLKFMEKTLKAAANNTTQRSFTLEAPGHSAVFKKLWDGSAVLLTVPIDEKLEVLGQTGCKSASSRQRAEGSRILSHFKNETNIAILKSLLQDPATSEATMYRSVPDKIEFELVYRKKVYSVRKAAFETLRELGVKVEKPLLEVLLEGRDESDPEPDNRKSR